MSAYLFDLELYCSNCTPDGARCVDDGGGESDVPQHCHECGEFLKNPLTQDGVKYVVEKIEEYLRTKTETDWNRVMPLKGTAEETMTAYHGRPHKSFLLDWIGVAYPALDNWDWYDDGHLMMVFQRIVGDE